MIDLYWFMVHPVVVGTGQRLFTDGVDEEALRLTHTLTMSAGVLILEYEPAQ